MTGAYMTIAEIEAEYPDRWVLIGNPTTKRGSLAPTGGYVVLHAPNRDEFYQRFEEWAGEPAIKHLASWYTGKDTSGIGEMVAPDTEPGAA